MFPAIMSKNALMTYRAFDRMPSRAPAIIVGNVSRQPLNRHRPNHSLRTASVFLLIGRSRFIRVAHNAVYSFGRYGDLYLRLVRASRNANPTLTAIAQYGESKPFEGGHARLLGKIGGGMRHLFRFRTRVGPVFISDIGERWHIVFDGESLGNYSGPMQAADDLASGHISLLPNEADTSTLGIPKDISKWERVPI